MRTRKQTNVLIVDDEPDIGFLFEKILLKRNLKTEFAKNLSEAYRAVEADSPFLIFLDNSLPDGQGVDFIPYLKQRCPGTLVIMVTANDSVSDKDLALQMGADGFLGKPLSVELINRTLDSIR
jgi:DNA-binding response OmpR family regulator